MPAPNQVIVKGTDKRHQQVGQTAAEIRAGPGTPGALAKGKGIRYRDRGRPQGGWEEGMSTLTTRQARERRHRRIRGKVAGTAERPRLAVFRSNKGIFAQLVDDQSGRTLAGASWLRLRTR